MAGLKSKISGIEGWVRFAVREKTLIYYLVTFFVVVGAMGLVKMNKDEFPTFQITQGLVAGVYPGATAEEVEQQLTKPLEEYLFSFKEVKRNNLSSITRDGMCYLYVDLAIPQEKKDELWSKIKLGLQARKQTLPAGVLAVAVLDDFSNTSSLLISVDSDDKNYTELEDYSELLCERLRKIPELAKVSILGSQDEEVAITIDKDRLSGYAISPSALMLAFQSSTIPMFAGNFSPSYASEPVRIKSPVSDEEEIGNYIVYSDPVGGAVRLKDIATIERRFRRPSSFISYNAHSCLVLDVTMRPDNNIVEFGKRVDAVLNEFSEEVLPPSVKLSRISDQPKVVDRSIWNFLRDLLIAMLVVVGVMLLLFPLKSALIAGSGVPVCTAVAVCVMYVAGMELNTVTLAALIVCLGMIVDDSIITMDGYMDKTSRGLVGADAAAASAKELFLPTFVATLAICMMFFPCKLIIKGYLGDFVSVFPWVILIALMTSLVYAVTVVPSLEVRFIKTGVPEKKNLFLNAQEAFFDFIQRIYEKAQAFCFRHYRFTLGMGVVAVLLGVLMFTRTNVQMMPMADREYFVVEMELKAGSGVERTKAVSDSLTRLLLSDSRVKSVTSFVGTAAPRFVATYTPVLPGPEVAQMIVNTVSVKATGELLDMCRHRWEHHFPDAVLHFKQMGYQVAEAPLAVRFHGDDRDSLVEPARKMEAYMRSMNGLQWVHSDVDNYVPSVNIVLDPDEAGRLGVNKTRLALSLAGTFDGVPVANICENGRQVPVNMYTEGIDGAMDYSSVSGMLVSTAIPGVSVPLGQVAQVGPDWSLAKLVRNGGSPSVTVFADLQSGASQPPMEAKLKKYYEEEVRPTLPQGVSASFDGLSSSNREVLPDIAWSFLAAVSVLFIFLMIHFRKTSIAVLTMVLSSLCLFGASFGLWALGLDFSMTAVLGLISLVGIIVRNGILLFDYAEEAHYERGLSVMDAALEAGQRRMRPIFLTSCTTALGVLPMILSGDQLWMPMGVVICFGIMLSIFLIVLIMPVSYWRLFRKSDDK